MPQTHTTIELAVAADAAPIAVLSRDLVETGLGWSWRMPRLLCAIRASDHVVLAARANRHLAGAAVMVFGSDEARLNLLVVAPAWQRKGLGSRLVRWLEASALTAGISVVYLEVRAGQAGAQRFYRRLGYRAVQRLPGYYSGRETALVMARDLTLRHPADTA
jgi:ribosomal-protein-alanine N-acetyltransferase